MRKATAIAGLKPFLFILLFGVMAYTQKVSITGWYNYRVNFGSASSEYVAVSYGGYGSSTPTTIVVYNSAGNEVCRKTFNTDLANIVYNVTVHNNKLYVSYHPSRAPNLEVYSLPDCVLTAQYTFSSYTPFLNFEDSNYVYVQLTDTGLARKYARCTYDFSSCYITTPYNATVQAIGYGLAVYDDYVYYIRSNGAAGSATACIVEKFTKDLTTFSYTTSPTVSSSGYVYCYLEGHTESTLYIVARDTSSGIAYLLMYDVATDSFSEPEQLTYTYSAQATYTHQAEPAGFFPAQLSNTGYLGYAIIYEDGSEDYYVDTAETTSDSVLLVESVSDIAIIYALDKETGTLYYIRLDETPPVLTVSWPDTVSGIISISGNAYDPDSSVSAVDVNITGDTFSDTVSCDYDAETEEFACNYDASDQPSQTLYVEICATSAGGTTCDSKTLYLDNGLNYDITCDSPVEIVSGNIVRIPNAPADVTCTITNKYNLVIPATIILENSDANKLYYVRKNGARDITAAYGQIITSSEHEITEILDANETATLSFHLGAPAEIISPTLLGGIQVSDNTYFHSPDNPLRLRLGNEVNLGNVFSVQYNADADGQICLELIDPSSGDQIDVTCEATTPDTNERKYFITNIAENREAIPILYVNADGPVTIRIDQIIRDTIKYFTRLPRLLKEDDSEWDYEWIYDDGNWKAFRTVIEGQKTRIVETLYDSWDDFIKWEAKLLNQDNNMLYHAEGTELSVDKTTPAIISLSDSQKLYLYMYAYGEEGTYYVWRTYGLHNVPKDESEYHLSITLNESPRVGYKPNLRVTINTISPGITNAIHLRMYVQSGGDWDLLYEKTLWKGEDFTCATSPCTIDTVLEVPIPFKAMYMFEVESELMTTETTVTAQTTYRVEAPDERALFFSFIWDTNSDVDVCWDEPWKMVLIITKTDHSPTKESMVRAPRIRIQDIGPDCNTGTEDDEPAPEDISWTYVSYYYNFKTGENIYVFQFDPTEDESPLQFGHCYDVWVEFEEKDITPEGSLTTVPLMATNGDIIYHVHVNNDSECEPPEPVFLGFGLGSPKEYVDITKQDTFLGFLVWSFNPNGRFVDDMKIRIGSRWTDWASSDPETGQYAELTIGWDYMGVQDTNVWLNVVQKEAKLSTPPQTFIDFITGIFVGLGRLLGLIAPEPTVIYDAVAMDMNSVRVGVLAITKFEFYDFEALREIVWRRLKQKEVQDIAYDTIAPDNIMKIVKTYNIDIPERKIEGVLLWNGRPYTKISIPSYIVVDRRTLYEQVTGEDTNEAREVEKFWILGDLYYANNTKSQRRIVEITGKIEDETLTQEDIIETIEEEGGLPEKEDFWSTILAMVIPYWLIIQVLAMLLAVFIAARVSRIVNHPIAFVGVLLIFLFFFAQFNVTYHARTYYLIPTEVLVVAIIVILIMGAYVFTTIWRKGAGGG